MNNETFGAKLTLLTSEFKNKLKEASEQLRQFGKKTEEETTIIPKFEIGDYSKEIEKVQDEMDALRDAIQETKLGKTDFNLEDLKKQYEQLLFKLIGLKNAQKDYNDELENTDKEANKNTSTLGKLFDQSIGKIKRFTYYLLGARSAFSMFMKYQSIYYQYNEKMQYQAELSRNAIALSLAPAFEFLGNVMAYVSIAFAKFIQLLTGVNVLSKVTTKGIRDYNKSLKETQTLVSGIDEITNLTMPSGTGLAGQYDALKKFKDMQDEFDKWWEKFKIDFTNWFANPDTIKLIKEKGLIGSTLYTLWNDLFKPVYDKVLKKHVDTIINKFKEDLKPIWEPIVTEFGTTLDLIKEKWNEFLKPKIFDPIVEEWNEVKNNLLKLMAPFLNNIISVWNDTFGWLFGKIDLIEIETDNTKKEIINDIDEINKKILNIKPFNIKGVINLDMSKAKEKMNKLINVIDKGGNFFAPVTSSLRKAINNLEYAKGLDYVPYDEYPALLHKGEAVVPAKYNPTIHSQGNEYTNSLLETLVMKVDDLANRPNVFEVDGQQFASATYGLYRNEETRQNYNMKVRVNNG